jgi:cell division protein FtsQ
MARKSGPTILQEELYPPAVPGGRDAVRVPDRRDSDLRDSEIDDARLIDLEADEEPQFLRGQKRVPARKSSLPKKTASGLLWALVAATILCVVGLALAGLYNYGQHSWRFRVESSDNIEVTGMRNVTKAQIMEVLGADIGRNIFFIPLAAQKAQLEQIPWVDSASVLRFVPNRLKVEILERTPVAFARVGSRMALIDAGGTLMELTPQHKYSFPVILGMNAGEPLSTRAPRMKAYREMVRELDADGARYSQELSEVDLSDLEDVKVRVNDPAGDVLVHLGSQDYLSRYRIFVTHEQAWRAQFQRLESVDLRYDNQIIVNPDMQRVANQKPLTTSMAKTAAAAGVKPAALLARAGAGRALPRPAFELTSKTLEGKRVAGGAKKTSVKAAAGKPVAKPTHPVPGVKEMQVAGKPGNAVVARNKAALAARAASGHGRLPVKSAVAAKPGPAAGGQKPSPAIAKAKDQDKDSEPSD